MDADAFWREQLEKNCSSKPKYTVCTDAGTEEDTFMLAWFEKWHQQFFYFDNRGCGCCINIYDFDAPIEAIAEIPQSWLETPDE